MSDYIKHDFKSGDTLYASQLNEIEDELVSKQAKLVSGTNIKTIGNSSILGSGNLSVYAENGLSLVNNEVVFDSTYGTVGADVEQMREDIGDLDDLTFDADNMVDAVNKAYNHIIDFPIYICSQTLYDYISYSGTTRKNFYLRYKEYPSYNSYMNLRKISVPNGYKIMFRISASICTSDANYFEIGINDTPLISSMTWSGDATNFSVGMLSNLFSFEELPIEKAYMFGTENDAFNMYCKNNASGTGYARDITIHAYLVKNTSE